MESKLPRPKSTAFYVEFGKEFDWDIWERIGLQGRQLFMRFDGGNRVVAEAIVTTLNRMRDEGKV